MVENKLAKSAFSNFIWSLLERFGASGVTFIVSVILARNIEPEAYGLIAIVTVVISIMQAFVDGGLGAALVQKKNSDDLDFSSVFYFNIVFSTILYGIVFGIAPAIAKFYESEQLCAVIRVLGVVIIISSLKNIQQAYVTKYLLFKKFFFSTIGGTVIAAMVGIWMAYRGYGIWALVFQNIVNQMIDTFILWKTVEWRPLLNFSSKRLFNLLSYGVKILGANLIASIYSDVRQLAIGKVYSTVDLAYYNQGYKYPFFLMSNINSSIDSVLFPVMVKVQDELNRVKSITKKSMQIESFILFPFLVGMGVCASRFIPLLLGEKWGKSVPYLQIFCLALLLNSMHTPHFNALKAVGRSDLIFKVEFTKKSLDFIIMFITLKYGVLCVAIGVILEGIISYIITAGVNGKTIGYSLLEQFKDIFPALMISFFMGAVVYVVGLIHFEDALIFVIQIVTGVLFYLIFSFILKPDALNILKDLIGKNVSLFREYKEKNMNN